MSEAQTTDRAGHARRQPQEGADIALGPLFTAGLVLVLYGIFRRRPLALVAGLGAVWLDQRSEFGKALKERIRAGTNTSVFESASDRARPGSENSA